MSELPMRCRGAIYPWHCDHVGHMNVMWYTVKFDEASWNIFAMVGLMPTFLRENARGVVAVEQKIKYLRELHAGDIITIRSRLLELAGKKIRFIHEMINGETLEVAATTELMGLCHDKEISKSCTFPDEIQANARQMIAEHATVAKAQDD